MRNFVRLILTKLYLAKKILLSCSISETSYRLSAINLAVTVLLKSRSKIWRPQKTQISKMESWTDGKILENEKNLSSDEYISSDFSDLWNNYSVKFHDFFSPKRTLYQFRRSAKCFDCKSNINYRDWKRHRQLWHIRSAWTVGRRNKSTQLHTIAVKICWRQCDIGQFGPRKKLYIGGGVCHWHKHRVWKRKHNR